MLMKKIHLLPALQRPREKLQRQGVDSLSLVELICVILGTGTKVMPVHSMARRIARLLEKNSAVSHTDLLQLGISPTKSAQILASLELHRRVRNPKNETITKPEHIYAQSYDILSDDKETILCYYFNARGELLKREKLAVGSLNQANLLPREIFHVIKELPVASIILAHNHPSGSTEATSSDVLFTQRVKASADILGITLLDHLIVTKSGWKRVET